MDVDRVDSDNAIQLFEKLEARNPDKKCIYLILDNAPYHRSAKVRQWLERKDCKIKPIWLPTYCPHLNAIERSCTGMSHIINSTRHLQNLVMLYSNFYEKPYPNNGEISETP
ncbi:MAG: transposase [Robiginitomaculum sp.]